MKFSMKRSWLVVLVGLLTTSVGASEFDIGGVESSKSTSLFDPIDVVSKGAHIKLSVVGAFRGGMFGDKSPSDSPVYEKKTQRLFIGSQMRSAIEVIDLSDPSNPTQVDSFDVMPYGGEPNSMAMFRDVLVTLVQDIDDDNAPNQVVFMNPFGELLTAPIELMHASKVAFSPNGRKLVVSIVGKANDEYTEDPEGGVAIIDVARLTRGPCRWNRKASDRSALSRWRAKKHRCDDPLEVQLLDFKAFDDQKDELIAAGIRIYGPNASVAQDLEPGDVTISRNSKIAYLSMQPNNAVAVVDIHKGSIDKLLPLGTVDHSLPGNGFDPSDEDGRINIANWPVKSFSAPSGVQAMQRRYGRFFVLANEGDLRDEDGFSEEVKVGEMDLDPVAFPKAEFWQDDANLGRLRVTNVNGDADGDGLFEEIFMMGSRSISIYTAAGERVFHSGDDFEQITARAILECFNCPPDANEFDSRSPRKGVEPEHLTTGKVHGREYVFVALERIGGIMVYDISNPYAPQFQQYINNRNFAVDPRDVCGIKGELALPTCPLAGDLEPEALVFIPKKDSPIGVSLVVVGHESSDSVAVYRVDKLE